MSRNYLEALIIILVTVALGYFLVWPKSVELKNSRQLIEEKNAEIKNRQDYYANLEKAISELDQYGEIVQKIDTAFPVDTDAPSFMNFLQAAAMQSGLILGGAGYSGTISAQSSDGGDVAAVASLSTKKYSLQNYSVSVELTGSYANFKNFLSRVEHSSRLAEVGAVKVSSKKDGGEKKDLQQSLTAEIQNPSDAILNYSVKLNANYYQ